LQKLVVLLDIKIALGCNRDGEYQEDNKKEGKNPRIHFFLLLWQIIFDWINRINWIKTK